MKGRKKLLLLLLLPPGAAGIALAWVGLWELAGLCLLCALSNPQLGHAIYIGSFCFGAEQWRVCYALYVLVMAGLFLASFFVKDGRKGQ